MSLLPRDVDFNGVWSGLQEIVHAVITFLPISPRAWQHGFADVYLICSTKSEAQFIRLYAETKQMLIDHVSKLFYLVQEGGDSQLIKNYYKHWTEYSTASKYLNSLYEPLNSHYRLKRLRKEYTCSSKDIPLEIAQLAFELWRDTIIAPLGPKLVTLLLEAIDEDRRCQNTSLPVEAIHGTILSFVDVHIYHTTNELELYKELFEEQYLIASGEYFKRGPVRLFEGKDVSIYMEEIIVKIEEEVSRARKFLHSSSLPKITHQIETLQQINSIFI